MSEICVGTMGGGPGTRYAALYFESGEAEVRERTAQGTDIVATVPLGAIVQPTDRDFDPSLARFDRQNLRLMEIVAIPRMLAAMRMARDRLRLRECRNPAKGADHTRWRQDGEMLREIEDALEHAETVPE
jgi:hypothetical protein